MEILWKTFGLFATLICAGSLGLSWMAQPSATSAERSPASRNTNWNSEYTINSGASVIDEAQEMATEQGTSLGEALGVITNRYPPETIQQLYNDSSFMKNAIYRLFEDNTPGSDAEISKIVTSSHFWSPNMNPWYEESKSSGDDLVTYVHKEEHLKKLKELGFDIGRASSESVQELVDEYGSDWERFNRLYGEIVLRDRLTPPEGAFVEKSFESFELEIDQGRLSKIPKCFKIMTDQDAAVFCQYVLDLFGKDRILKADQGESRFIKALPGPPCSVDSLMNLEGKMIAGGLERDKKSDKFSYAEIIPKIPISKNGKTEWVLDGDEKDKMPLSLFLAHSNIFCESKIVENKFKGYRNLLNMDLDVFEKEFLNSQEPGKAIDSEPSAPAATSR